MSVFFMLGFNGHNHANVSETQTFEPLVCRGEHGISLCSVKLKHSERDIL